MTATTNPVAKGDRVNVRCENDTIEQGTVDSLSRGSDARSATIRFDDDTYCTFPMWRVSRA